MQRINIAGRAVSWVDLIYLGACLLVTIIVLFDAWEVVLNLLAVGLR